MVPCVFLAPGSRGAENSVQKGLQQPILQGLGALSPLRGEGAHADDEFQNFSPAALAALSSAKTFAFCLFSSQLLAINMASLFPPR